MNWFAAELLEIYCTSSLLLSVGGDRRGRQRQLQSGTPQVVDFHEES